MNTIIGKKLIITGFFLIAPKVLVFITQLSDVSIKKRLEKVSPELLESSSWFFSAYKYTILKYMSWVGVIVMLCLMWFIDISMFE